MLFQGVELWAEQKERLAAALEFHSRYLLAGKQASVPSYMCAANPDPGVIHLAYSPTMEVGFNALAGRMKMALPLTEKHLRTQVRTMPDPGQVLIMMYETLTHGDAVGWRRPL